MCRVLTYLGEPIVVEELLYIPDNSFIKQSYNPKYMSHLLNLAGFGMAAWDPLSHYPNLPYLYKTALLPFYDENLRILSKKISPKCLLAHIRGVSYNEKQIVSNQNVHPFLFPHTNIALAHNGVLTHFDKMKYDLLDYIKPEYKKDIRGTTDSEWIYAVFLSQLANSNIVQNYASDDIINPILETLDVLAKVRKKHDIKSTSPVNLFITDGDFIAATRFVFDYGWPDDDTTTSTHLTYHSLWYTYGERYGFYDNEYKMRGNNKKSSMIIASEPLTEDNTTWIEVPEYTLIFAKRENDQIQITSQDISF